MLESLCCRYDQCTTLTLYLKGYTHLQEIKKKKSLNKRKLPHKRACNIKIDESDNVNSVFIVEQHEDHIDEVEEKTSAPRCTPVTACKHYIKLNLKVINLKKKLVEKDKELEKFKSALEGSKIQNNEQSNSVLSYSQVKDNDKMLTFYTGLQKKKYLDG